ncbi:hypothetical protein SAMN05518872_11338 [Psychrobacillus sp. OK032]|nr:hypothetical protein SAMN05518872_11338 [Psychrobacillus sp. OK032]
MTILKIGNVRVRRDSDVDTVIIKDSSAINESVKYINGFNVTKVDVDDFDCDDLTFLKECPSIEKLSILNHFVKDLSGIYGLKGLRVLAINETTTKNEFRINELKNLEELYGTLPKKTVGINELNKLKKVSLWGYKPKSKNLNEFKNLKNLNELNITQSSLHTLDGIEGIVNLKSLGLYYLRTLADITALEELKAPLTELFFENCKSIENFSPIQNLQELEYLKIISCGDIPSLSFVPKLTKLKSLVFPETNILDENLTVCDGIDCVYYTKKKLNTNQISSGKRNLQDLTKPTNEWTKRMADGDDIFNPENIEATIKVLDSYITNLMKLEVKPKKKEIMKFVKDVVISLNELNDKYDYFIETMEREDLCEYIIETANIAGLESDEDITEEWREW